MVFTSYRDDEYGGDTNLDGSSSGQPGDWGGISLSSGSYSLSRGLFRFGGASSSSFAVPVISTHSSFSGAISTNTIYAGAPSASGCYNSCWTVPGIGILANSACSVTGNTISYLSKLPSYPYPYGIQVTNPEAQVLNNSVMGAGTGIMVTGSSNGQVNGNMINGATVGISLSGVRGLTVAGNRMQGDASSGTGILITGSGNGLSITGR